MLNLEFYLVGFDSEENMQDNINFDHYCVRDIGPRPVIMITYDDFILFANNKKVNR